MLIRELLFRTCYSKFNRLAISFVVWTEWVVVEVVVAIEVVMVEIVVAGGTWTSGQ
jgi:hypothetical protein